MLFIKILKNKAQKKLFTDKTFISSEENEFGAFIYNKEAQ